MANTVSSNLLTTAQAADRAGMTIQSFYALCWRGNGPAVAARSGRRNLYRAEDVDAWTAGRKGFRDCLVGKPAQVFAREASRIIGRIAGDKLAKDEVGFIVAACLELADLCVGASLKVAQSRGNPTPQPHQCVAEASQATPGEAGEAPSLDTLAERTAASVGALVAAHKARPAELYKRVTELQAASQAVKAEHGAVSLAFMEAEQAVAKATLEACAAIKEAQRIEVAAQAFLAAIKPAETIAAPTRKSTAQRLAEARIALSTAK